MASIRLSSFLLLLFACAALAQAPQRLRGTITASDANVLTVNGKTQIRLDGKSEIVFAQPIALADLKPGDFLGVTSMRRADGTLTAYEVRRFPKPVNPGHRPFDGRDDQTMTNATVSASVESLNGRELTMTYDVGAPVNLTHDASGVALRIQVGPKR
jgi:hypothetical protein